jgi:hypothetical protein
VRGAQAILTAVDSDTPSLHLMLGSDACGAREKLGAVFDEMECWEPVTRSTDYRRTVMSYW